MKSKVFPSAPRLRDTRLILAIASATRQSCRERLQGIHQYAREHGFRVQVVERLFRRLNVRELLDTWQPVGVIAECGAGGDELTPKAFGRTPVVYIDAEPTHFGPGFYVNLDTADVGRRAADYLQALGYPNFAYVPFRTPVFWCAERREAFQKTLSRDGQTCHVFEAKCGADLSRWRVELQEWLRRLPRPCSLFAANDGMAEHVADACAILGLSVPTDIAVLGVDNEEPICDNSLPTLSSIAVDFFGAGYRAAELLGARLADPARPPVSVSYRVMRVVLRQSTRLCARGRIDVDAALEYIRRHAHEGIGVGDVVRELNVQRRAAELQFRRVAGQSILDAINDVRFAKVFDMLTRPRQSLKVIHDFCGFATASALRKAFRHRTGLSMSDWRDRHFHPEGARPSAGA